MVVSNKMFTPQSYLEFITGNCYIISGDDNIQFIENIINELDLGLWNYPLTEIDHIVENEINVVLVECAVYNRLMGEFINEYRWFEVPFSIPETATFNN